MKLRIAFTADGARLRVVLWHALGLLELCIGSFLLVGALVSGGSDGHLGFGVLLIGSGIWVWMRGVRARRSLARRSACE